MIDTLMALWNYHHQADRRRGLKILCAIFLICISISLLLAIASSPPHSIFSYDKQHPQSRDYRFPPTSTTDDKDHNSVAPTLTPETEGAPNIAQACDVGQHTKKEIALVPPQSTPQQQPTATPDKSRQHQHPRTTPTVIVQVQPTPTATVIIYTPTAQASPTAVRTATAMPTATPTQRPTATPTPAHRPGAPPPMPTVTITILLTVTVNVTPPALPGIKIPVPGPIASVLPLPGYIAMACTR